MADQNLRQRKDHRNMTGQDWGALIVALRGLRGDRKYIPYAEAHSDLFFTGVHGEYFLPWHRDFINNLELAMQPHSPGVAIPYWNWEESPVVPTELDSFRAELGLAASNVADVGNQSYDFARSAATWNEFNSLMSRGPHGNVHIQIGGVMATGASPTDPLFWLHHGFIDKVWADWQQEPGNPDPDNPDDAMPRSPEAERTVGSTINTEDMGFVYLDFVP